ncbi:hypothetical protein [Pseudosporangium ferrugineum]|uniref:Uncharacterized protein n=1 Tax=Pseudosporangium ferrugineum TaxID=439699 RepID=A0A2T0RMT0_9ACTN|nr:hypothetical protein [Pseudosporangium ferrugineum]PRY22437.1 hypothetical protein CLV70_117141 [Pseudosporangium ferrugineum]
MADDDFTITLTHDQALILSDWLHTMLMGDTPEFDALVNRDPAVWSPVYAISGALETTLVEVFKPDYLDLVAAARERLLDSLGEIGRPPNNTTQA